MDCGLILWFKGEPIFKDTYGQNLAWYAVLNRKYNSGTS